MVMNTALNIHLLNLICPCGKICKNICSLKIHQARIKYQAEKTQMQSTRVSPGEMQEMQPGEAHHKT